MHVRVVGEGNGRWGGWWLWLCHLRISQACAVRTRVASTQREFQFLPWAVLLPTLLWTSS